MSRTARICGCKREDAGVMIAELVKDSKILIGDEVYHAVSIRYMRIPPCGLHQTAAPAAICRLQARKEHIKVKIDIRHDKGH